MAWIESHQELANHPKTLKLARVLNISRVTAVGHLHFLWWWALDYAQDGDLSAFDAMDLAVAADWQGEPDTFVSGLQRAGFITDDKQIHDWDDYGGRFIKRREQARVRQQRYRDEHGRYASATNDDVTRDRRVSHTVTREEKRREENTPPISPPDGGSAPQKNGFHDGEIRHKTKTTARGKTRETDLPYWQDDARQQRFGAWYGRYPRKVNPQDAMKAWRMELGDEDENAAAFAAFLALSEQRWREWRGRPPDKIPYPASWIRQREWTFTRQYQEAAR